jgi:hypothetical protein
MDYDTLMTLFLEVNGEDVHNNRFVQSILYLAEHVPRLTSNSPTVVFEVGGASHFTTVFKRVFPNAQVVHTHTDIRVPFALDVPKVDLVLCMEVFEHLCDLPSSNIGTTATFTGSGMLGFLNSLRDHLHENSVLFITTPNVTNYKCIVNLLYGCDPFAYQPHHREVSPNFLRMCMEQACYDIQKIETKNVWNNHQLPSELVSITRDLITMIGQGHTLNMRDDDIFVLATAK